MNIIANSCVGGYIYKNELKMPFQNPFVWSLIDFNSMVTLQKDFYKIRFDKFQILPDDCNTDNVTFNIIIDSSVKIRYIHYKYSDSDCIPRIDKIDVYYNRIWEYVFEKYITRIKRMISSPSKPIYVYANWFDTPETTLSYDQLKQLDSISDFNIICAVDTIYPEFNKLKQIERCHNEKIWNLGLAHNIYERFIK